MNATAVARPIAHILGLLGGLGVAAALWDDTQGLSFLLGCAVFFQAVLVAVVILMIADVRDATCYVASQEPSDGR